MEKSKQQEVSENDLEYIILPRKMFKDYEVTYTTVAIYSYMLTRFRFFKSLNKEYFESIEAIAENCFCSTASVKTALNFLCSKGFLKRGKLKAANYNKNVYIVEDMYNLFTNKEVVKEKTKTLKRFIDDDDEDGVPVFKIKHDDDYF